MAITLKPEHEQFAEQKARELGYPDAGGYVGDLIQREQRHTVTSVEVRQTIEQIKKDRARRTPVPIDELIGMKHAGHRY